MFIHKADFQMYRNAASLIQAAWKGQKTRAYVRSIQVGEAVSRGWHCVQLGLMRQRIVLAPSCFCWPL